MDKNSSVKLHIINCRKLIEQQLSWTEGTVPTRREYETLLEKIFDKTGVLLSLSTIRRIWNNDYKNLPHKSTLDALAIFAGFSDWQNFIESNSDLLIEIDPVKKKNSSLKFVILSLVLIILIGVMIVIYLKLNKQEIYISGPVVFEYNQESESTVPNIVVFEYDIRNIEADSFFIVESSNDYRRKSLLVKKGKMTSSYYNPGNYEAFLIADDSIVRKLNIEILSNKWVALVKYQLKSENVPYYFYEDDIIFDNKVSVSREMIIDNNIDILDDLYLTLSNTFDPGLILNRDFVFESRLKLDSIEINLSCPKIFIGLLFEKDLCYIPIVYYGGQNKLQVRYGQTYLTSSDSDLSGFGCNIYEWQVLKIESKDSQIQILLNDTLISSIIDSTEMGSLRGFSFTFDGLGTVDFVSMINTKGDTNYFDSFENRVLSHL